MTRAEASRNNGRKSRGPKTPEGKRIASMNGVTHGLRSLTPALTNEDREGLERLERRYRETYRPAGPHEEELVEQMALAKWRETRAIFLETALYDLQMDLQIEDVRRRFEGDIDEPTRAAIAFRALVGPNGPLITVHRIEMDYVRLHRLSHKRLLEHQAQRLNSPTTPEPLSNIAEPRTPNSELASPTPNSEPHAACLNPFLPLTASTFSGETLSTADAATGAGATEESVTAPILERASSSAPEARRAERCVAGGANPRKKEKRSSSLLPQAGAEPKAKCLQESAQPGDDTVTSIAANPVPPPEESPSLSAHGDRPDEPGAARTPNPELASLSEPVTALAPPAPLFVGPTKSFLINEPETDLSSLFSAHISPQTPPSEPEKPATLSAEAPLSLVQAGVSSPLGEPCIKGPSRSRTLKPPPSVIRALCSVRPPADG